MNACVYMIFDRERVHKTILIPPSVSMLMGYSRIAYNIYMTHTVYTLCCVFRARVVMVFYFCVTRSSRCRRKTLAYADNAERTTPRHVQRTCFIPFDVTGLTACASHAFRRNRGVVAVAVAVKYEHKNNNWERQMQHQPNNRTQTETGIHLRHSQVK